MMQSKQVGERALQNALKRGDDLYSQGRFIAAVGSYDKAIAQDPDNINAHYKKGLALYAHGNYAGALKCYYKVVGLGP